MQNFGALDSNEASLAAQLGEQHVGSVHLHHLSHLIQTVEQDVVDLARADNHILNKDLHTHHQLTQFLLSTSNLFRCLSRDVNLILAPTIRTGGDVAENLGEWRGEVNGGAGSGFDELDVLAGATTNQGVHGRVEFNGVHVAFELYSGQLVKLLAHVARPTIWSIMINTLVLACSELSRSP